MALRCINKHITIRDKGMEDVDMGIALNTDLGHFTGASSIYLVHVHNNDVSDDVIEGNLSTSAT